MARSYSAEYKSTLAEVNSLEPSLILLEIIHPDLSEPVRIVNDTDDIVCKGNTYVACPFRCSLPDDFENQIPKASLAVDNVGRELMYWIENSGGGAGSKVRFIQMMRSRPDLIEWEITMSLFNVHVTMQEVTAELGFDNLFAKQAISMQYRPENSPALF